MSAPVGDHFPSPVGGAPFAFDLAPSVFFAVLYGVIAPLILYRAISPSSRSLAIMGTAIFGLERSIDFILRALEARHASDRVNKIIVAYMQTTYASGFISIGQTLLMLLTCLLIHAAKGDSLATGTDTESNSSNEFLAKRDDAPGVGSLDGDVNRRVRFIRIAGLNIGLWYWAAFGLSVVWGGMYHSAMENPQKAQEVEKIRYIASGLGLFLLQLTNVTSLVAAYINRRVPLFHALYISGIACLLSVTAIYRLVVMRCQTVGLESTASCSLNSDTSKVTFYIFHIVPEFLSVVLLFSFNVREMYQTGVWGHG